MRRRSGEFDCLAVRGSLIVRKQPKNNTEINRFLPLVSHISPLSPSLSLSFSIALLIYKFFFLRIPASPFSPCASAVGAFPQSKPTQNFILPQRSAHRYVSMGEWRPFSTNTETRQSNLTNRKIRIASGHQWGPQVMRFDSTSRTEHWRRTEECNSCFFTLVRETAHHWVVDGNWRNHSRGFRVP